MFLRDGHVWTYTKGKLICGGLLSGDDGPETDDEGDDVVELGQGQSRLLLRGLAAYHVEGIGRQSK